MTIDWNKPIEYQGLGGTWSPAKFIKTLKGGNHLITYEANGSEFSYEVGYNSLFVRNMQRKETFTTFTLELNGSLIGVVRKGDCKHFGVVGENGSALGYSKARIIAVHTGEYVV